MKNIYLIPTEKISKLFKLRGKLHFEKYPTKTVYSGNQHLYITSDEEIKGWCLNIGNNEVIFVEKVIEQTIYHKKDRGCIRLEDCKKIILTTDTNLIKDGIQSIDNVFLRWFIKNPSCEKVEVKNYSFSEYPLIYKIIIPKEESKQDLEKEMFELEQELDIPSNLRWHNSKPKQETKEIMNKGYIILTNELYVDNYDLISIIFTKFRPTYIERTHWLDGGWTIYGECKDFREVKEGEIIPRYEVVLTADSKKVKAFKFKLYK